MKRKILIMGLPGSGKTTLAEKLVVKLNAAWFNADAVRQDIYSELGFSPEDRLEHAERMGKLCKWASMNGSYAVADFVCPTKETRNAFDADFVVWVNRIEEGRYEDTNKMFEQPEDYDVKLEGGTPEEWVDEVINKLNKTESWDNQAPTALLIGRYQPFHIGHKTLVAESIKRSGQCCIALRDVGGINDSNPYDFEKVKKEIEDACKEFGNKIKVVELPNITDVFYGRGVGYNIEQLELSRELQEVSATKIRDGQIGQDGKPLGKRPE
jgi:nicotinamide riboside kinase/phosphopantetheine adenylyltransferase